MSEMLEFALKMNLMFGGNTTGFTQAGNQMRVLQERMQGLQKTSGQVSQYQRMQSSLMQSAEKLNQAQYRVKALKEQMRQVPEPTARMRKEFTQANLDAHKLQQTVQEQRRHLGELGQALTQAGVNTRALASEQSRLTSQLDQTRNAQQKLTNARERFASIKSQFTWDAMKNDVLGAMASLKVLEQPIRVGMDFDQAMAQVNAVLSPTREVSEMLRAQSLELGRTTQFSATQAAQTQEVLARAGFAPQDIVNMLPAVLNMASAEGMDLVQAGSVLSGALRGIKMPTELTPLMADILAFGSANSATSIANLGEAFKLTAGTASLLGINAEELTSYLMVMANAQVESQQAGNALSSSFLRLARQPKMAADALAKYNVAVFTRSGAMRKLPDMLKELYTRTLKEGSAFQLKAFGEIFGTSYADTMIKLAQGVMSGEQARMETDLYTRAAGQASRMSRIRNDNLKGDVTALGSAWEGLMIRISDALAPITRFLTQELTAGISSFTEFLNQNRELADWAIRAGTAFMGWKVIGTAYRYVKLLVQLPFAWLEATAAGIGTGMGAAAVGAEAFSWSIGGVLKIVGLVGLAVYEIYQHWDAIVGVIQRAYEALKAFLSEFMPLRDQSDVEYGIRTMESTYSIPEIAPHATGGIMTQPHIGLVAEAGPEAIIPLRDRSRGLEVLTQAASILGVPMSDSQTPNAASLPTISPASPSMLTLSRSLTEGSRDSQSVLTMSRTLTEGSTSLIRTRETQTQTQAQSFGGVTVNVNVDGRNQDDASLATRIAESVRDAIMSLRLDEERLNYA